MSPGWPEASRESPGSLVERSWAGTGAWNFAFGQRFLPASNKAFAFVV
jgi:hypothetical protein